MFTELHAVVRHTPLTLICTAQGERLSIIITPRPGKNAEGNAALSAPIRAVGTPAELDAELPAKLVEYTEKINALRLAIDLPVDAIDAATAKAGKKATAKPTPPAAKKPAKKAAPPPAAKQASTPKPEKQPEVKLPGTTKAKRASPVNLTREDLVAACRELIAKHGDNFDREFFIKHVKGGRGYERKFDSFKQMITLAQQVELPLGETSAPAGETPPPASTEPAATPAAQTAVSTPPEAPAPAPAADATPKSPFTPLSEIAEAMQRVGSVTESYREAAGRFSAGFDIVHNDKCMTGRAWIDVGGFEFDNALPELMPFDAETRTALVEAAVSWLTSLVTIQGAKAKSEEDKQALLALGTWARTFTEQREPLAA